MRDYANPHLIVVTGIEYALLMAYSVLGRTNMEREMQKNCPQEESVFLLKSTCDTVWQVPVPGAFDVFIKNGKVVICASSCFFWEVDSDSSKRRRIFGKQPLM